MVSQRDNRRSADRPSRSRRDPEWQSVAGASGSRTTYGHAGYAPSHGSNTAAYHSHTRLPPQAGQTSETAQTSRSYRPDGNTSGDDIRVGPMRGEAPRYARYPSNLDGLDLSDQPSHSEVVDPGVAVAREGWGGSDLNGNDFNTYRASNAGRTSSGNATTGILTHQHLAAGHGHIRDANGYTSRPQPFGGVAHQGADEQQRATAHGIQPGSAYHQRQITLGDDNLPVDYKRRQCRTFGIQKSAIDNEYEYTSRKRKPGR